MNKEGFHNFCEQAGLYPKIMSIPQLNAVFNEQIA